MQNQLSASILKQSVFVLAAALGPAACGGEIILFGTKNGKIRNRLLPFFQAA